MSGLYNDRRANHYATSTEKSRSLISESELNTLPLNSFKKLLKYQANAFNEKISEIVSLIFYFKDIRNQILEFPNCGNFYCENLPCILKETYTDANRYLSTASRGPQVGLSRLIDTIHRAYSSKACTETPFDLLLLFFHSFSNAKCSNKFNPGHSIKLNNKFQCKCGKGLSIPSEANFFSIQISSFTDFIGESIQRVLKTQLETQTYKICSNTSCAYKDSKKIVQITQAPAFIIFKFNWNEDTDEDYIYRSIKTEFNLSDFNQELFKVYKACVFLSETKVYYEEHGEWFAGTENFYGFSKMIEELSRNRTRIIAVVYKKNAEVSHSANNTLTDGLMQSPMIRSKQSVASPLKQSNCCRCSLTLDKCRCHIKLCQKCSKNMPTTGIICDTCRDTTGSLYSTYSSKRCLDCGKNITQGSQCTNCSIPKTDSTSSFSMKKTIAPSTKCLSCPVQITEGFCTYCSTYSNSVPCSSCKNSKTIKCQGCKNKTPAKRTASTSAIQKKKCSFCTNFLKKDEELNCSICLITKTTTPCRVCYNLPIQYICTSCMKKKRNIKDQRGRF